MRHLTPHKVSAATRAALVTAAVLISTSAFAGSLPIQDTFGDAAGCQRENNPDQFVEGGITLNASELVGYEWACTFAEVWVFPEGDLYGVQALCGAEGVPNMEQYIIAMNPDDDMKIAVHDRDGALLWDLTACQK